MEMAVPIILGFAALASMLGTLWFAMVSLKQPMPIPMRVLLFMISAGCIGAFLSLLYFIASWLPYDLEQCFGIRSCAAIDAVKQLVDARWQSATAAAIFGLIAITAFIAGIRIDIVALSKVLDGSAGYPGQVSPRRRSKA